jgi:hypothetical protein
VEKGGGDGGLKYWNEPSRVVVGSIFPTDSTWGVNILCYKGM